MDSKFFPSSSSSSSTVPIVKVLGVAGGIGCGKSTACKLLVNEPGCLAHIDADQVAHSVYEPGNAARSELINAFGSVIINPDDDSVNRHKLGNIVFADADQMKRLENIVWPHTRRAVEERIFAAKEKLKQQQQKQLSHVDDDDDNSDGLLFVIVEAAMLLDANWNAWMDGVWMVTADAEQCRDRVVCRSGGTMTPEQAQQRILAQSNRRGMGDRLAEEIDRNIVTAVILNNGSIDELRELLHSKLNEPSAWY